MKSLSLIALFGFMFFATQSFAQRGNRSYNCYENIPGLTTEQVDQIEHLRTRHFKELDNLKAQRRSTYEMAKKDEIRTLMPQKRENHRNAIRALLTDEQKEYFDVNYPSMGNRQGKGRGNGNGPKHDGSCINQNGKGQRNQQ